MNPGGNAENGNEAQPRDLQGNLCNFYSWKSEGMCMCSKRELNAPHFYIFWPWEIAGHDEQSSGSCSSPSAVLTPPHE